MAFMLYNPLRKLFSDRRRILGEAGVAPGRVVLEAGAGNGFFTEVLVDMADRVIAVELQEEMAMKLKENLSRSGAKTDNLDIRVGDVAEMDFGSEAIDVVLLYFSLHEISRQKEAAEVMSRALKPGGTLSIVEPKFEVGRRAMTEAVEMFEGCGLSLSRREDTLFTRKAVFSK